MEMQDKRFEGEKRLSEKLLAHEYAFDEQDLTAFDAMLNHSEKRFPGWIWTAGFFLLIAVGIALGWLGSNKNQRTEKVEVYERSQFKQKQSDEQRINRNQGLSTFDGSTKTQEISFDLEAESETTSSGRSEISEANSVDVSSGQEGLNQNSGKTSTQNGSDMKHFEPGKANLAKNSTGENRERTFQKQEQALEAPDQTVAGKETVRMFAFDQLPSILSALEWNKASIKVPAIAITPLEIHKDSPKRISFGMQYNVGKTHAGYHETPWVSGEETTIEGLQSFGYGLFGQININRWNFVRTSFSYNKMGHRQRVHDLRYQTGFTSLVLELYSHELKFGADYGFRLLPNFNRLDINLGVGLAYHNVISEESNNYWTEFNGGTVQDLNEVRLGPLSYKAFVSLEVGLYKEIRLGVEPYVIYQKRRVRYTSSIFLADVGNYNISSGLNFTVKF